MKIDKRLTSVSGSKALSSGQVAGAGKPAAAKPGSKTDKLHLTASTAQLRELETEVAKLDVLNTAKVNAVKLAISNGSFRVDSEVVADSMIEGAKEAVRKRPRKA